MSPSLLPRSNGLIPFVAPTQSLQTTIRITVKLLDSQGELFPLQSPLLGESWLVSFPLLINMLKFGRSSYLIWDPIGGGKLKSVSDYLLFQFADRDDRINWTTTWFWCYPKTDIYLAGNSCVWCIISQSPAFQEREIYILLQFPNPRVQRNSHKVYWLSGVCGHSNKHTPGSIPEVQCAFKDLMIHESCRSHYVSHFAAFFIVVGAKTSVAESVGYVLFHLGCLCDELEINYVLITHYK